VRRTVLLSGLTLVSRLLGFVREMMAASLFGDTSAVFDAFITAWRVPNLFRRFLGEGAISTALQTELTEVDADLGDEAGRVLFWRTVAIVARLLVAVCGATMLAVHFMPDTMPVTGWHWLGADPAPVRELTLRVAPFVVLVCLSALAGGALNVRGHFATPALAPVTLNLCWIATLALIADRFTATGADAGTQLEMARVLAWGVLAAGGLQLVVQVPALARFGLLRSHASAPGSATAGVVADMSTSARRVIVRSAPLAIGAAIYQINVLVDGLMAEGLLPDGGPTVHYFANRVQQFPLALIAVAATSAVFPALKAMGHAGRTGELRSLHDRTQRAVCFLALPATAGLLVLAQPTAAVLFERGAFGAAGVERTADVLRMLALALVPAGAVGLTSRTYYSLGDFRTPVVVSVAMVAANCALNLGFVLGAGMDADGLALATAISSWGNLALLLPGLTRRHDLPRADGSWRASVAKSIAASVACGLAAYLVHRALEPHVAGGVALGASMLVGAAAFAAGAVLLRSPETGLLRRRFRI
jgi:putative peptidoglycan lipid II flippase